MSWQDEMMEASRKLGELKNMSCAHFTVSEMGFLLNQYDSYLSMWAITRIDEIYQRVTLNRVKETNAS